MSDVLNIAGYQFAPLTELPDLQTNLRAGALEQGLRGTILLAPEGINLFLAGSRPGIEELLQRVRAVPGLERFTVKESFSRRQPFRKLLVKIKREIITFGRPEIDPAQATSRRVAPRELKAWLDAGRDIVLLDTRNTYEVEVGTFENAIAPPLVDFQQFPEMVAGLPADLKDRSIVTFCTGGIRCEKAAPWLERAGFRDVFQLDGGILKYFEDCGGAHFVGNCFVFDTRAALTPGLEPVCDGEPAAAAEQDVAAAPQPLPGD